MGQARWLVRQAGLGQLHLVYAMSSLLLVALAGLKQEAPQAVV
jgi:hypothetical protein